MCIYVCVYIFFIYHIFTYLSIYFYAYIISYLHLYCDHLQLKLPAAACCWKAVAWNSCSVPRWSERIRCQHPCGQPGPTELLKGLKYASAATLLQVYLQHSCDKGNILSIGLICLRKTVVNSETKLLFLRRCQKRHGLLGTLSLTGLIVMATMSCHLQS